jgi:hypothetical protein
MSSSWNSPPAWSDSSSTSPWGKSKLTHGSADDRDEAYELSVPQVKDLGEEQVSEWPGKQRQKWW